MRPRPFTLFWNAILLPIVVYVSVFLVRRLPDFECSSHLNLSHLFPSVHFPTSDFLSSAVWKTAQLVEIARMGSVEKSPGATFRVLQSFSPDYSPGTITQYE